MATMTSTGKGQKVTSPTLSGLMDKIEHYVLFGMVKPPMKIEISLI